jgi:cobalt-zinc-cadmium resistance protein CzcA
MLRGLIAFCLLRRPLVLVAYAVFLGLGFVAFTALNIEAYPDPAPPIIEIIAQRPGQSPEEMERYVTIPIEIAIASTPGSDTSGLIPSTRSASFGFSSNTAATTTSCVSRQ